MPEHHDDGEEARARALNERVERANKRPHDAHGEPRLHGGEEPVLARRIIEEVIYLLL